MDTREERVLAGQNNGLSRLRNISHFELFCGWRATQEKENCSVESLHVFELNEDGYWTFLVSDSHKLEVFSLFQRCPSLIYDKHWYMLNRHTVKRTCLVIVFRSSEALYAVVLQSKYSSLNLTEWISGVSDLEVTLRLTYPLTAGAPNCFTVYSHLAKGVKTDSKHPVMKLISSWETVSLTSSVVSMTC